MAAVAEPILTRQQGIAGTPVTLPGAALLTLVVIALTALIKAWPALRKISVDSDASLRADFMQMRAEDRAEHAKELASIRLEQTNERRSCEERLHAMQMQIDGLVRQIVAFQVSSGRAMGFTPEATASADRVLAAIEKKQGEAE